MPRIEAVTAGSPREWPVGSTFACDHAGLCLLMAAMAELGLDALIARARYPSTNVLSSFHSLGTHLLLKCSRRSGGQRLPARGRPGLGLILGLSALPVSDHVKIPMGGQ